VASILKIGDKWRAQIRRKGHAPITQTFDKQSHAKAWAARIEEDMRAGAFNDERRLADITIDDLIKRYEREIGEKKPFGRSKAGALDMLRRGLTGMSLAEITSSALVEYAKKRNESGAGGVTIGIEMTYLAQILRIARTMFKIPFKATPVEDARPSLKFMTLVSKSLERDRRPTDSEISALCAHFDGKPRQRIPMSEIIRFAIATTMRAGEITSLRRDDLNEAERTILIRDRKHPQEKIGNNQTVPLLGEAFDIAMRQPKSPDGRVFPYNEKSFSTIFPRACTDLKIIDLHFHDLRHEGISRLFEQGYRIEQVALVSGHRDWKMLRRYTQVRARDLHRGLFLAVSNGDA
jgi:integrase